LDLTSALLRTLVRDWGRSVRRQHLRKPFSEYAIIGFALGIARGAFDWMAIAGGWFAW
jgi:hypothetical protein